MALLLRVSLNNKNYKDAHVCVAAFSFWRIISLTRDIHCRFGKVILKIELTGKWIWVENAVLVLPTQVFRGRPWGSEGWGAERWRGAWSYGEVVGTAHFWSPVHLKCILNTFLWILGIELWGAGSWEVWGPFPFFPYIIKLQNWCVWMASLEM